MIAQTLTIEIPTIEVRKTAAMRKIERNYFTSYSDHADIRKILVDALIRYPTDAEAAYSLGIEATTISIWISRLAISDIAESIRAARKG